MSLYRKYRPQTFKEVIGEDHIVKVLSGAIKLGNISHAYLFSGSRGTGKTSVARIFAKEVGTSANDLYEIDAASTNSVDDIREINEAVHTLPFESKYKVYIIDEAHMLSKSAWNAFLKTLEEPPQHVIFILATTELEKVPETVISRCQTFVFKQPNQSVLKEFAQNISKKEGFTLSTEAAELIALLGDGSFRDTHGIIEKIIFSTKDKKISREEVEAVTGAPRAELVRAILEAIVKKDLEKGIKAIHEAREMNADMKIFSRMILEKLRFVFLIRLKAGMDKYIEESVSPEDLQFLQLLAKEALGHSSATGEAGQLRMSDVLARFITASEDVGRTNLPTLALELALADCVKS